VKACFKSFRYIHPTPSDWSPAVTSHAVVVMHVVFRSFLKIFGYAAIYASSCSAIRLNYQSQPQLMAFTYIGACASRCRRPSMRQNFIFISTRRSPESCSVSTAHTLHTRTYCVVWPFLGSATAIARHQNTWRETCSGQSTMIHVIKRFQSASSHKLVVRRSRLKTVGDRVFGVAAPRVWNACLLKF